MSTSIAFAQAVISLLLLVLLYTGPVARLRRDNFRSTIRRIREQLFDFMYQNNFDFKDPAYRATRGLLNSVIRASNFFSVSSFLSALAETLTKGPRRDGPLVEIEKLPDGPLKTKLTETNKKATLEVVKFIFLRRIAGWIAILLLLFVYLIVQFFRRFAKKSEQPSDKFVEAPARILMSEVSSLDRSKPSTRELKLAASS
jgi:hypothetical protein